MAEAAVRSRPTADVVNAFVEPVVNVLRSFVGIQVRGIGLHVADEADPPPSLVCTVEMIGRLAGPITWCFSEELVQLFASRLLATEALDELERATCIEAVSELANIVSGNASGLLRSAGYQVEILPPRVHGPGLSERRLKERTLVVTLDSTAGTIKVFIGLRAIGAA